MPRGAGTWFMDIDSIRQRLRSVRARAKRLFVLNGLSILAMALVPYALATFLIDWAIPDVPPTVRLVLLGGGIVLAGAILWRRLVTPLRAPLSDDALALKVEEEFPELGDRLISALQLAYVGIVMLISKVKAKTVSAS